MTKSLKIVRFHFDENGGAKPSAKCEATLRIKISQILIFDAYAKYYDRFINDA
jgi:hypothetical protein